MVSVLDSGALKVALLGTPSNMHRITAMMTNGSFIALTHKETILLLLNKLRYLSGFGFRNSKLLARQNSVTIP